MSKMIKRTFPKPSQIICAHCENAFASGNMSLDRRNRLSFKFMMQPIFHLCLYFNKFVIPVVKRENFPSHGTERSAWFSTIKCKRRADGVYFQLSQQMGLNRKISK